MSFAITKLVEEPSNVTVTLSEEAVAEVPIEFFNAVAYEELLQSKTIIVIFPGASTVILEEA